MKKLYFINDSKFWRLNPGTINELKKHGYYVYAIKRTSWGDDYMVDATNRDYAGAVITTVDFGAAGGHLDSYLNQLESGFLTTEYKELIRLVEDLEG